MADKIFFNDIAASTDFTVTATNSETTYPVANVQSDIISSTWRSTGIGNVYITFNGSATHAIKGVAVLGLNTATWATLQAQASNDNFSSTLATQNLTIATRYLKKWDTRNKIMTDTPRYDAYYEMSWPYEDVRILFNSTDVSYYECGRIYIFLDSEEMDKSPQEDQPADIITFSTVVDGAAGQRITIPQYQKFSYKMMINRTTKYQADWLKYKAEQCPSLIYFIDGITSGQLLFGSLQFGQRITFGKVFGPSKISIEGTFTESL